MTPYCFQFAVSLEKSILLQVAIDGVEPVITRLLSYSLFLMCFVSY